ncbi:MAG TPA: carboxypeptidase-like regulatory domain-containing protein [Bryobacteraceae bacterium]
MKLFSVAVLFGSLALGPRVFGQASDGNLVGSVLDPSGAGIPNAEVELANVDTGIRTLIKTDAEGEYRFNNVVLGTYNLTATAVGFGMGKDLGIVIELNKTTTANISLPVGAQVEAVNIVESPELLDTTTAQIAKIYDSRMTAGLALATNPTGGVYNLALLSPGVTSSGGTGGGYGPSVGGQRPRNNNFTIEGVDNNNKNVTGPNLFLPNDAVAEFSTLQNQFSAEFGHSSGGQFNVVIKSGTNEVHGTLYEYLQNRMLDANDQSSARIGILTPPRSDESRLGATAGGPLMRNKWFIFGAYEYNPSGQAAPSSSPIYAPTQAGYNLLNSMTDISQTNLGILEKYAPPAATAVRTTTVNGVAIPYGIFPIVAPSFTNAYTALVSSDYTISDTDQLRGRYVDFRQSGVTGGDLPVFFTNVPTTDKLGTLSEFHTFSPTLFNEARLAASRFAFDVAGPQASYPGLDVFPNIVIRNDLNLQIGPDQNAPQGQFQNTYQIIDNLSWSKGRHDFKFGFDGRDLISASTAINRVRGDYEWTSLQGFLDDTIPDYIAQRNSAGKPYSGNDTAYYWYVNDNWRYNHHLTLNLGVRYEFNGVAQSIREFALNSIADVPGVLTFRAPQAGKKNFAPRIGLAYSPGTSGNTVIRAGFGIAYDQIFDNIGVNTRPPQATSTIDITGDTGTDFLKNGGIVPSAPPVLTPAQARTLTSGWLPPNQQLPYAISWNIGVQHSFAKDYTAEIRYLGTKGVHLLFQSQLNRNSLVTPTNFLPTYLQAPSQATLNSLTLTTAALTAARVPTNPAWDPLGPYGFTSAITSYGPRANSLYNGLALDLKKRYSRNLLFDANYTWSHNLDDSSAELNTIVASPRRPQDFNDIANEWANSALDRRHRLTFTSIYETPWFRGAQNPLLRNGIGNWEISGSYMVESGEWATPQSGVDSNQNGDSNTDRAIVNPNGVPGTSSDVTPLKNSSGATVAYLATNPNAQFIKAQIGAFATSGRNIMATPRIDNVQFTIAKNFSFREKFKLQLRADMFNALNHPQYTLGRINDVKARNTSGSANWFIPGNPAFGQWDQVFSSNPRSVQVGAKVIF